MSEIDKDLVEAIGLLDPKDKSHFTEGGEPSCNALSELLGRKVSKDERNTAFAAFKQTSEPAPEPEKKPKAKKATSKTKEPKVAPQSEARAFTFTGSYRKDGTTTCRGYTFVRGEKTHVPLTDESAIRRFSNHPQFEG